MQMYVIYLKIKCAGACQILGNTYSGKFAHNFSHINIWVNLMILSISFQ